MLVYIAGTIDKDVSFVLIAHTAFSNNLFRDRFYRDEIHKNVYA